MNFSRLLLSATTILLLMVLIAIACKKDISNTSLDLEATALSASRDGNPCNGNEELANLSYQAIRFGDLEGAFEMYNDIQPVTLEPLAEPVIAVYHSQGRPAAFALMAQQGAQPGELEVLGEYMDRLANLDLENLTIGAVETFVNDYLQWLCINHPPAGDLQNPNLGDGAYVVEPPGAGAFGRYLIRATEGTLKALIEKQPGQEEVSPGALDRGNWLQCGLCFAEILIQKSIYGYYGFKAGQAIGGAVGAGIGATVGTAYGLYKAFKEDSCKSCFGGAQSGSTCTNPTHLTVRPVACGEVELELKGFSNLPADNFDWFNDNALPTNVRTDIPRLRVVIPQVGSSSSSEVFYESCNESQDDSDIAFHMLENFHQFGDNFTVGINQAGPLLPQQSVMLWANLGKIWYDPMYEISFERISGHASVQAVPNSRFQKNIFRYSSGGGDITIRVSVLEKCTGQSFSRMVTIPAP